MLFGRCVAIRRLDWCARFDLERGIFIARARQSKCGLAEENLVEDTESALTLFSGHTICMIQNCQSDRATTRLPGMSKLEQEGQTRCNFSTILAQCNRAGPSLCRLGERVAMPRRRHIWAGQSRTWGVILARLAVRTRRNQDLGPQDSPWLVGLLA